MATITLYRLAEQVMNLLEGGSRNAAASISMNEIKISCVQVLNKMLKVDYVTLNGAMGEMIPNGIVVATYEDITPQAWVLNRSKATLPIKPMKLRRGMGVYSVYLTNSPDTEFIPLQMGQRSLLQSQVQISDLLGQVGYENKGLELQFTKDLTTVYPGQTLTVELLIMDIAQYTDYDILPISPEFEWDIVKEVYQLYSTQPLPDKLVDSTVSESVNVPLTQQKQAP